MLKVVFAGDSSVHFGHFNHRRSLGCKAPAQNDVSLSGVYMTIYSESSLMLEVIIVAVFVLQE